MAHVELYAAGTFKNEIGHITSELKFFKTDGSLMVRADGTPAKLSIDKTVTPAEFPGLSTITVHFVAVILALQALTKAGQNVFVTTKLQLIMKGMTAWVAEWQKNGWMKAGKNPEPVKDQAFWQMLIAEASKHNCKWAWSGEKSAAVAKPSKSVAAVQSPSEKIGAPAAIIDVAQAAKGTGQSDVVAEWLKAHRHEFTKQDGFELLKVASSLIGRQVTIGRS